MKLNFNKANITMSISILFVSMVLVAVLFIQYKTVEQVNETDIENLRDSELSELISTWKSKYEEVNDQLQETISKIYEYKEKIAANEEASELLDEELKNSNLLLGTTEVTGEGVVITLEDNNETHITASNLIELVNELWTAGAEAISINGVRVINTTEIVDVAGYILIKPKQRITSPYEVKAIGDQTYLTSTLCLKNSGFIDRYQNIGKTVSIEQQRNIKIPAYTDSIEIKYMQEVEEE